MRNVMNVFEMFENAKANEGQAIKMMTTRELAESTEK